MVQLPIEQLLRDSPAGPLEHLDLDRVKRYSQMLDELPPVTVFRLEDQSLLLADGYHRVAAARAVERAVVEAEVLEGTKADAMRFALELARRERGFSHKQARDAIRRYSGERWPSQQ